MISTRARLQTVSALGLTLAFSAGCANTYNPNWNNGSQQALSTSGVQITLSSQNVASGGTINAIASGGTAPYHWSLISGMGQISSTTGVFTAPNAAETDEIEVDDANGNSAFALITVTLGAAPTLTNVTYEGVLADNLGHLAVTGSGFGNSGAYVTLVCNGAPISLSVDSQSDSAIEVSFTRFNTTASCTVTVAANGTTSNALGVTVTPN